MSNINPSSNDTRTIDEVAEALKHIIENRVKCTLILGAGCSYPDIPLASGFVERIKNDYPYAYARASEKTYPQCMEQLEPHQRHKLIAEYIDNAGINCAHLGVAQLMKHGFVDRVLTVNFDPLILRACNLVNCFPAVYDMAASQLLKQHLMPDQSVFYLHGQRTGFVTMHTEQECSVHASKIASLFDDAESRLWIVVGYSGDNDKIIDLLAKSNSGPRSFDNGLYWVQYKDHLPATDVKDKLLSSSRYAYRVEGYDADDFFVSLCQKLDCFPPSFVSNPFAHLQEMFRNIKSYILPEHRATPDGREKIDFMDEVREKISIAEEKQDEFIVSSHQKPISSSKELESQTNIKSPSRTHFANIMSLFMAGKYERIIQLAKKNPKIASENKALIANCYFYTAFEQQKLAKLTDDIELFKKAQQNYESALEIQPNYPEALHNLGNVLSSLGRLINDVKILEQANKRYEAALLIKSDYSESLFCWGISLSVQGQLTGELDFFEKANQKYEAALKISPDHEKALYSWGLTFMELARRTGDTNFLEYANEKYEAAVRIKPDYVEALGNWGTVLMEQIRTTNSKKEKGEIYQRAEIILTKAYSLDSHQAYNVACLSAICGEEEKAKLWLEIGFKQKSLPSRSHIEKDDDLKDYFNKEWFRAFLALL